MNVYLENTLAVLYLILYPVIKILQWLLVGLLFVLRPLWRLVAFLLLPLVYLGQFTADACMFPFRLAARFEVSIGLDHSC